MSTNLIGQTLLNQFRIDAFIASGGMGAVYRVWDIKRNVPLAMKILHSDLADDPSMFKRFKREANALKKLAHPNIVPFYGLYQTTDFAFLLERYIDGPSLKDILRKQQGKPLLIEEMLTYIKALSAALGYAHANGVVHCDVKPGNVMIDQGGNIYLTDFGIARHSESTTTTLATMGTAAYMAPEQIRGEPVSPSTDIYALGVMLFEMLTGQRPFKGDEKGTESSGSTANERIRFGHLKLTPPDPCLFNPSLSSSVSQVILKALEKDPIQRFPSTRDLFFAICSNFGVNPESVAERVPVNSRAIHNSREPVGNFLPGNIEISATTSKLSQFRRSKFGWITLSALGLIVILSGILLINGIKSGAFTHQPTTIYQNAIVLEPSITTALIKTSAPVASPIIVATNTLQAALAPTLTPTMMQIETRKAQDDADMIFISAGEFLMGSSENDENRISKICPNCDPLGQLDQFPQRKIYLDSYWIDQTEITNEQFARFVTDTGHKTNAEVVGGSYVYPPSGGGDEYVDAADWQHPFGPGSNITGRNMNPVVQVSWEDANAYCNWAGMRLPTEAEWERAARGDNGGLFPWGDNLPNTNLLNFDHQYLGPMDVGGFPQGQSPFGLMDMAGNVWEWVSDFYQEYYYEIMSDQNPQGPTSGEGHTMRGGSWATVSKDYMDLVTTTFRLWNKPNIRSNVIGFRCAMDGNDTQLPSFGPIHFCRDSECSSGQETLFPEGIKAIFFLFNYENMKPGMSYGRRWYVNDRLYLDYTCTWGTDWPTEGIFLKKVYDYDYSLAPGEWRIEIYIDGRLQETATFTVQGPLRYEKFLEDNHCNDTSPTLP